MPKAFWLKTVKHIDQWSFVVFQVLDYLCTCTFCMDILNSFIWASHFSFLVPVCTTCSITFQCNNYGF